MGLCPKPHAIFEESPLSSKAFLQRHVTTENSKRRVSPFHRAYVGTSARKSERYFIFFCCTFFIDYGIISIKENGGGIVVKTFHITDYGAKICDRLQTSAIQKAIDDCFLAGGGRVVIPCGIFLTGGIRIRSGVQLYLESGAILKGSRDPEDYLGYLEDRVEPVEIEEIGDTPKTGRSAVSTSRWCNALIHAFDAHDFSVIGEKGSYIDGSNVYDSQGEQSCRGPHGMSIWRCKNMHFEGYTLINSSNWAHAIFKSQNITFKNVTVHGGFDGIDIRTCDNVLIE